MLMNYEYDYHDFPLAYLITIRCYGTWVHGDERGAVDRHGHNLYGTPKFAPNRKLQDLMLREMKQQPLLLSTEQREVVETAIHEVCQHRGYDLKAVNARSNHVHTVVSAQSKPEPVRDAFKSYATRKLREARLIDEETRPWARGGSRRYLWKPRHVALAIEYVLYGQGDIPGFEDYASFTAEGATVREGVTDTIYALPHGRAFCHCWLRNTTALATSSIRTHG